MAGTRTEYDVPRARVLAAPPHWPNCAVFLDVDGTLLEHAEEPQAVCVDPRMVPLMGQVHAAHGGALALISGRAIVDLDALFFPATLAVAGQHGCERRSADGTLHRHASPQAQLALAARTIARQMQGFPGLVLENKGMTLALHYRRAPGHRAFVEQLMRCAAAELGKGFELQAGKFVCELKPNGRNKGTAVQEFLHEAPFAGRMPVFIGDDLTDEYAFRLVNRRAGQSIKVGPGRTAARWRLADARAVRGWLAECVRRSAARRRLDR